MQKGLRKPILVFVKSEQVECVKIVGGKKKKNHYHLETNYREICTKIQKGI